MAATSKVKRVAGLSLAAAVAGSMTLVPAASAQESSTAQESAATVTESSTTTVAPSPTEPTVSATQSATVEQSAAVTTTPVSGANNAGEVAAALQGLAGLAKDEQPVEGGAGTSGVEQTSGGWDFTALARNPQNDRLYAISKKKDTKGAGRLLRIAPQNGAVKDLGPIEIEDADATKIDTAAFTADGTLVLFDDTAIHTLDLSEDKPRSGTPELKFVTKDLKIEDTKTAGTPAAWAPNAEAGEKTLVALSVNDKGEPFVWTLDVDAKAPVATHKAATAPADVDLKDVETLNYAYSEGEEATFANDDVAITLQGENVGDVNTDITPEENREAIAGTGSNESTDTPASEEKPNTITSETTEATTTTTGTTTATNTPANSDATKWVMDVLVRTSDDKAVEGAEFKSEDGRVSGVTGADGRAKVRIGLNDNGKKEELIQLTLKEAPKGYKNAEVLVDRGAETAEIVLPRDPNVTTLNRPQQILKAMDDLKPIATSVLAPAAAMAGAAGMVGGQKTTRTPLPKSSSTTSTSAKRSTGRTTSARNASRYSANRNSGSGRVASNGSTSTKKATTSRSNDERDGDLADTGTPMRAIISLGILAMLIGGAYLALGRRRES